MFEPKITPQELNPKGYVLTPEQIGNQAILLPKMRLIRLARKAPMIATSGVRSKAEHLRVYAEKGITDLTKIPMNSKHLIGAAIDIADPDGKHMEWCIAEEEFLYEVGIWIERGTKGWVHFQCEKYASWVEGKTIFFNP
jgi:hypothetical protein